MRNLFKIFIDLTTRSTMRDYTKVTKGKYVSGIFVTIVLSFVPIVVENYFRCFSKNSKILRYSSYHECGLVNPCRSEG
jgi:hypothetical protein